MRLLVPVLVASHQLSPAAALAAGLEHGWLQPAHAPQPAPDLQSEGMTSLVQYKFDFLATSGGHPLAASMADQSLKQFMVEVNNGFFSQSRPAVAGCGKSTLKELSTNLDVWQRENPKADGFCHFQNHAFWFQGAGTEPADYGAQGRATMFAHTTMTGMCLYLGQSRGPERNVTFERGEVMTLSHLDHCVDAVDDPYCYSIGWLKGQRLDGVNMSDAAALTAKGREECSRIQSTYGFTGEDVTVGRHIFGTPIYLQHSMLNAQGKAKPVTHRMYNEHVYTKCILGRGSAPSEMAYCYYKGCVLPDGKIGHNAQCGYD